MSSKNDTKKAPQPVTPHAKKSEALVQSLVEMNQVREQSLADAGRKEQLFLKSLEAAYGTAEVTLTVTHFVNVLPQDEPVNDKTFEKLVTKHCMKLVQNHFVTALPVGGPATSLAVDPVGPVAFKIRIEDDSAVETYFPVGIAFRRSENADQNSAEIAARRSFFMGGVHIFGRELYFNYDYADFSHRKSENPTKCEFFVIIQRERGGLIGIIDPGIQNSAS